MKRPRSNTRKTGVIAGPNDGFQLGTVRFFQPMPAISAAGRRSVPTRPASASQEGILRKIVDNDESTTNFPPPFSAN
jgi:hypothetical protein